MAVLVRDALNAMQKNGYPKVKGKYTHEDEDGNIYACAIGQAALNLNVEPAMLGTTMMYIANSKGDLYDYVTELNDTTHMTVEEIAKRAKIAFRYHLNEVLFGDVLG